MPPVHPAAAEFPLIEGDEFLALVEDIRANGQREACWLWRGQLLDGRNRWRACDEVGVQPKTREFNEGETEALKLIESENLRRRHLTPTQGAFIADAMKEHYERAAKDRQREHGGTAPGKSRETLTEKIREVSSRHHGEAVEQAAKAYNTNSNYVREAEKIRSAAPDVAALAKTGAVNIPQAKKLASLDQETRAIAIEKVKAGTGAAEAIRETRAEQISKRGAPEVTGKYRVIYADPPWSYGNSMPPGTSVPTDYYPSMELDEICALPVKDMAEDNAVLFLWTTSPHLEESFRVINAWGFKYKSSFVWDKVKHNMGHYNSVRHEFLLVCVRGSCQPDVRKLFDSVVTEERTEHSKKPETFAGIIDTIYTNGARVELFSRRPRDGWKSWGFEAQS